MYDTDIMTWVQICFNMVYVVSVIQLVATFLTRWCSPADDANRAPQTATTAFLITIYLLVSLDRLILSPSGNVVRAVRPTQASFLVCNHLSTYGKLIPAHVWMLLPRPTPKLVAFFPLGSNTKQSVAPERKTAADAHLHRPLNDRIPSSPSRLMLHSISIEPRAHRHHFAPKFTEDDWVPRTGNAASTVSTDSQPSRSQRSWETRCREYGDYFNNDCREDSRERNHYRHPALCRSQTMTYRNESRHCCCGSMGPRTAIPTKTLVREGNADEMTLTLTVGVVISTPWSQLLLQEAMDPVHQEDGCAGQTVYMHCCLDNTGFWDKMASTITPKTDTEGLDVEDRADDSA